MQVVTEPTQGELNAAAVRVKNQLDGRGPTTSTGDLRLLVNHVLHAERVSEPVNAEILAVADRFERRVGAIESSAAPNWRLALTAARFQYEDERNAAVASAREQAADDASPVNDAWLREIGFVPNTFITHDELQFPYSALWARRYADNEYRVWYFNHRDIKRPETRGELRRLLSALGIPFVSDAPPLAALKQKHSSAGCLEIAHAHG